MPRRRLSLFDVRQSRSPGPAEDHNVLVPVLSRPRPIFELRSEPISAGLRRHRQPMYPCRGAERSRSVLLFRRRRAGVCTGRRVRTALFGPCPIRECRCQSTTSPDPRGSADKLASAATGSRCLPNRYGMSCTLTFPSWSTGTTYQPWIC